MNAAKLSFGINQLRVPFAIMPKWQPPMSLGPFLQVILMLNITQGSLVKAFTPVHKGGLKYKFGRVFLWLFSPHAHPNPLLPSFQKQGPSMLCSTSLHVHLSPKVREFQVWVQSSNKRYINLWEAQRYSCRFTATKEITDNRTFPLLRRNSGNSSVPF